MQTFVFTRPLENLFASLRDLHKIDIITNFAQVVYAQKRAEKTNLIFSIYNNEHPEAA